LASHHKDSSVTVAPSSALLIVLYEVGHRMKYDFSVSLSKESNHLTVDNAEDLATSIARLIEENETLRRLAALLTSQLDLARGLAGGEDQQSSR
jgi:hypothetical protein